jgi:hypothetical protein
MKKWIKKLGLSQEDYYWTGAIVLFIGFIAWITPKTVWNTLPATGGDTGSHFFPLWVLVEKALPHFQIRTWSPGNLMGEPLLLHYFPGPFLFMAFLSLFMPLGLAFNIGTMAPLFAFPMSLYFAMSRMNVSYQFRFAAVAASFLALFNESYSMWGGNATSLLAGQYAHLYALNFLFITIGVIANDLKYKNSYWAAIPTAITALCHSYIFMLLPFVFLSFLVCGDVKKLKQNFKYFFIVGILGILMAAWFLIPQIMHAPWMTGNAMKWEFSNVWKELFPINFRALAVIFLICFPVVTYWIGKDKLEVSQFGRDLLFWLIPIVSCVVMFFIFPKFGLVDVRAVPQINIFFCIIVAYFLVSAVKPLNEGLRLGAVCIFIVFCLAWTKSQISNYPHWVNWNYSGWTAKPKWVNAKEIFEAVKGDFTMPRMSNEHNPVLNDAGTTRIFESLPMFAKRATMESLYQEANQMSPMTYFLQARISKQPSCPIRGWDCTSMNFEGLDDVLKILGVKDLILASDEAKKAVLKNKNLKKTAGSGVFEVWSLDAPVSLVEVVNAEPGQIPMKNYQRVFYDWLLKSNKNPPQYLITHPKSLMPKADYTASECHPSLAVDFNLLKLKTDCPGKLHLVKFAYHPTFKASTGDELFMMSPGFMGIVPSANEVEFKFGQSWLWTFSSLLSALTLLGFLIYHRNSLIDIFFERTEPK